MEYAQARMQARHGARPDEALWQRLGGQASLDGYLAAARATPLAGWLAGIGDRADCHDIELALRQRWREAVVELARWMPREWQPAVRCCAALVDLPALSWLAAGGQPQRWMEKDPALVAALAGRPDVGRTGPAARAAWLADWQRCWPAGAGDEGEALARLAAAVEAHLDAFPQLPVAAAAEARRALARDAARRFRRLALRPVAAFAWLLLLALDLERLRAELVLRALAAEPTP